MRTDLGMLAPRRTALEAAARDPRAAEPAVTCKAAILRLALTDFRGYSAARLAVEAAPVVLTGPNGAGKTNLLEALSFLAPGRGLRRAKLGEIDRRVRNADGTMGAPAGGVWAVHAAAATPKGPIEIGTGREAGEGGERRIVRIDGATARSQAALAGHLTLVWLTPAMDRLFIEANAGRRRFFDRLVYGFDPEHAARVSAYEQAMRERARLLRDGPQDPAWLDTLEDTMATAGVAIAAARREVAARLDRVCAAAQGAFPAARLELEGEIESALESRPALAAEEAFRTRLAALRAQDRESGTTAVGPHRSDLMVRHASTGMAAAEGSTGEQKALLIAIVLGHARLQAELRAMAPVLLLDEVAAHLDRTRRAALFGELLALDAQTWLTGTDAELFAGLRGRGQFFAVADATLAPA